jgi:hypothetical protein
MPLTVRLNSPLHLFRKLERESYRAFHAPTPLHKADHFFNFCVTAASMRDYVLEYLNKVSGADRTPYYQAWAKIPALVAAAEIGNSSKHFVLREKGSKVPKRAATRTVRLKKTPIVNVYADEGGRYDFVQTSRTEIVVTLSDGQRLELHAFTTEILRYWKQYLSTLGLVVRRQSFAHLSGG